MTVPPDFDPRTASRADYERQKSAVLLARMRQFTAPQPIVPAQVAPPETSGVALGNTSPTSATPTPAVIKPSRPVMTMTAGEYAQAVRGVVPGYRRNF